MKRNFVLILVLAALVVAMLSACRRDDDDPVVEPGVTPAVTPAPTPAETPEPTPEPVQLLNREIRIICWWQYMPSTHDDQPDPATSQNYYNDRLWRDNQMRVEEQFGVTFYNIVIPRADIGETYTTGVLAGAPVAEWTMLGSEHKVGAITRNLIMSADMFAPPEHDLFNAQRHVRQINTFQDRVWSFGRLDLNTQVGAIVVNMDIINAIGAPNPLELWERGEWTWDAMMDIMQLAMISTIGGDTLFGIGGDPGGLINRLIASNDGPLICLDTMTVAMDHPNTMEALQFAYDIFSQRMWHYDTGYNPMGNWNADFYRPWEGRAALFVAASWAFEGGPDGGNWPHFEHTPVPFPIGPSGSVYNRMSGFSQGMTITAGVYRPDDVFMLYYEIMTWYGDRGYLIYEAAYEYTRRSWRTEDDVQMILHVVGNPANSRFELGAAIPGFSGIYLTLARHFFNGTMSPATAIETYRGVQQGRIDDFIDVTNWWDYN